MCFSVNVNLVKEELENRYGATFLDPEKYKPSYYYHAFGLPELPVICSGKTDIIQLLKWGLIPSWVKTTTSANEIRFRTFNARAESINKKPAFSFSFSSKRKSSRMGRVLLALITPMIPCRFFSSSVLDTINFIGYYLVGNFVQIYDIKSFPTTLFKINLLSLFIPSEQKLIFFSL